MTKSQSQAQQPDLTSLVYVHSDEYINWKFSEVSVTQGRRWINAHTQISQWFDTVVGQKLNVVAPRLATPNELALVHTTDYINQVLLNNECSQWTGKRSDLAILAQTIAGGTLVALDHILSGRTTRAVHLAGAKHHAQAGYSSGFCVFADLALAAKVAVSHGLKVAIFDFDAHHGDGTENLLRTDPFVLTFSVHQSGIFPGTGNADEPEFHVYNEPLSASDDNSEQALAAADRFARLAKEFEADIVFFAAGADGHVDDRLTGLRYTTSTARQIIGRALAGLNVPVLLGGAGGYEPDTATPAMWLAAVQGLHTHVDAAVARDLRTSSGIQIAQVA